MALTSQQQPGETNHPFRPLSLAEQFAQLSRTTKCCKLDVNAGEKRKCEAELRLDAQGYDTTTVEVGDGATTRRISPDNARKIQEFVDKYQVMAKQVSVEVLSDTINYLILRTPSRNFPGMVIQGDSLAKLYRCASDVCRLAKDGGDEDLAAEADALCRELGDRLAFYEKVLEAHGIEIPYSSPLAKQA